MTTARSNLISVVLILCVTTLAQAATIGISLQSDGGLGQAVDAMHDALRLRDVERASSFVLNPNRAKLDRREFPIELVSSLGARHVPQAAIPIKINGRHAYIISGIILSSADDFNSYLHIWVSEGGSWYYLPKLHLKLVGEIIEFDHNPEIMLNAENMSERLSRNRINVSTESLDSIKLYLNGGSAKLQDVGR